MASSSDSNRPQSIINMANALYGNHLPKQPQHEIDDRLDAARALLGVSPSSVADGDTTISLFGGRSVKEETVIEQEVPRRPRSDSAGLEALAFLATKEQASITQADSTDASGPLVASAVSSSSSDDDSEAMPPPPPRAATRTRRRSVSNPEGMEKWATRDHHRLHFVLPASILEEELAEASAALKAKEDEIGRAEVEVQEDEELDQDELLRRARSRLLEDLSEGNLHGEKGVVTLPHSLAKYKDVYNKDGRIGIYSPAERAAIINRFHSKRTRRVWNKKIRYNCRKNLADRRMRVKGRFVKRSTEEEAKAKNGVSSVPPIPETEEAKFITPESSTAEEGAAALTDQEMPDVSDPDAGFCPTEDQPFRRLRRHTIT